MTPSARPVVIFGIGELAQLARFYFVHDGEREVAGFVVDARYRTANTFDGLPLVATADLTTVFPPADHDLFVAIGYSALNSLRAARCAEARALGYALASHVSSRASIWHDLEIGDNCLLMEGNVIQPFVRIGNGVIMFASSVVSHHAQIGDYCFIGSEATLSGGVRVGARTFIGVNATIREHVLIGSDCIVGARALILKNTLDGSSHLEAGTPDSGIPSRRLRSLL